MIATLTIDVARSLIYAYRPFYLSIAVEVETVAPSFPTFLKEFFNLNHSQALLW